MRTTVIPAQITSVEDKIAGNLNFIQLLLLVVPVILNCLIYTLLPERMQLNMYKGILMVSSFIIFATLAIRIKGKVLVSWLILIAQYNLRPKYYLFNKNDLSARKVEISSNQQIVHASKTKVTIERPNKSIISDLVGLEAFVSKKPTSIRFKPNKGGMYVAVE